MNAPTVLEGIAAKIRLIKGRIEEAETLIDTMREAGEDVADLDASLRAMKSREIRWEGMLTSRGIEV